MRRWITSSVWRAIAVALLVVGSGCGSLGSDPADNHAKSCISVVPADTAEFGLVTVGEQSERQLEIRNCHERSDLYVEKVEISGDASEWFLHEGAPSGEGYVVEPGETETVEIVYRPEQEGEHSARLEWETNADGDMDGPIELHGTASSHRCPIAEATATSQDGEQNGTEIAVGTYDEVELSGADSTDPDGTTLTYQWELRDKPGLSHTAFEPSPEVVDPVLPVDVPGEYLVELSVRDEFGIASCEPALVEINSVGDHEIHVQLAWNAVGGGETPVDLDLHYVHEEGTWGENAWSVYAFSPSAYWDDSQVYLEFDSVTGRWPENLYHDHPEPGRSYHVGAHRISGGEPVEATLTVVFEGDIVFESDPQTLEDGGELWYVGSIDWSDEPGFTEVDTILEEHPL